MNLQTALFAFFLYGFLGWCLDSFERSLETRRWTPGGFSRLPFTPIYGFGALLVFTVWPWIVAWPLLFQFVFFALGLGAFEYGSGYYCERVFGRRLWDYSTNQFNFAGRTDLFHLIAWGTLALLLVYFIHPLFFGST